MASVYDNHRDVTDTPYLWFSADYNDVEARYSRALLEAAPFVCPAILTTPGELRTRIEGVAGPFDFETAVPVTAQA